MADTVGGRLGDRVASIVTKANLDVAHKKTGLVVKYGMALQEEFFKLTGFEIASTIGPMWRKLGAAENAPDWFKDTANFIAEGKGQWASMAASFATGAIMGGGLQNLITDILNPEILPAIAFNPTAPLDPGDAATMGAKRIETPFGLQYEAAKSGINWERYNAMVEMATVVPDVGTIAELTNRRYITIGEARRLMQLSAFREDQIANVLALRRKQLSTADASAMYNRGIISEDQAVEIADKDGTDREDALRWLEMGGEPPDLQTILLAWRRGILNDAQVDRAIQQGPIRFEYIDAVKAMQWLPLPVDQAASAVLQGHMSEEDGAAAARLSGILPEDFSVFIANSGRPPGPSEALEWLNRGLLTEDQFRKAFLESTLKNEYIDPYLKSRWYYLPVDTVRVLYTRGAMTAEQAAQGLAERGVRPEHIDIILNGAHVERTARQRDLTVSELIALYESGSLGVDEVTTALKSLGYDDQEVAWELALGDARRGRKFREAAINRVHTLYVSHRMDSETAQSTMDSLHVPPAQRDDLMALWDLERQATVAHLSVAQIQRALRSGQIDQAGATARFIERGYTEEDAAILVEQATPSG